MDLNTAEAPRGSVSIEMQSVTQVVNAWVNTGCVVTSGHMSSPGVELKRPGLTKGSVCIEICPVGVI